MDFPDKNPFESIKISALRSVIKPTGRYSSRHIQRWYSRTFSTPLHIVEKLNLYDITLHYYEDQFENMDPEERIEKAKQLIMTKEERFVEMVEEASVSVKDEDFYKEVVEEAKAQEEKNAVSDDRIIPELAPEALPNIDMDFSNVPIADLDALESFKE